MPHTCVVASSAGLPACMEHESSPHLTPVPCTHPWQGLCMQPCIQACLDTEDACCNGLINLDRAPPDIHIDAFWERGWLCTVTCVRQVSAGGAECKSVCKHAAP